MKLGVSSRSEIVELTCEPVAELAVSRSSDERLSASEAHCLGAGVGVGVGYLLPARARAQRLASRGRAAAG